MPVLHKIKAYLYDNVLTRENATDFIARASSERSLNVNEICRTAVSRGGADITAAAMQHAVDLFLKEMAYQLSDGYSVNTGYFTASARIRGVFDSPAEKFNPEKHALFFEFTQGAQMRKEIANIDVEIMGLADSSGAILQVTDVKSGLVDDVLTPGRNLRIAGSKIKVAGDKPGNGVFFVNMADETRTAVEADEIVTNNPSELIIVIPALPAGEYRLEVVTQYSPGALLKSPRAITFDKTLTVG